MSNSNRFRKAPAHNSPTCARFPGKPWPNNGIAQASSSWNDDSTLPGSPRTDHFPPMTRSTVFAPFDIIEGDRKRGIV
ncbi:hypothetical protein EN918_25970, partial [Mesorhizobium sp. M7A.F.Ca.CA.004.05.1.1]